MKYAMIKNGNIENIIIADYTMAQTLKQNLGYEYAVNVDNYPVSIGDLYENGSFMIGKDIKSETGDILIPARTVIERQLNQEEYIIKLENENKELKSQVDSLNIAMASLLGV